MAVVCLEWIGWITFVLVVMKLAYNISFSIYAMYLASFLQHNIDPRKYGPWAVVSGATEGIGKAYAQKFAAMGLNVVLISRTQSKLQQVADEIKREHSQVQIRTIAVDFTDGDSIYPKLRAELANLSIGILINNVGMTIHSPFVDIDPEEKLRDIINCNVMSMVRLTNMLVPRMKKKKRGLIVCIGSLLAKGPATLRYTTYGATKNFIDKFAQDLAAELSQDGVIVQSVLPGLVATKMSNLKDQSSTFVPSPETFVNAHLRTLGIETRSAPYWTHRITLYLTEVMFFFAPGFSQKLANYFMNSNSYLKSMENNTIKSGHLN